MGAIRPAAQPVRDEFEGAQLTAYNWVVQRERNRGEADENDRINPYYGALLNSPELCYHISSLGRWARLVGDQGNSFGHADREWVDQVLSQEIGSTVVVPGHLEDALAHGIRIEAVKGLWTGDEEVFTPEERLLTDFIRQVFRGTVTDECYAAVQDRMGVRGAVDYTMWILYLHLVIRGIEALTGGTGPDRSALLQQIEAYADGSVSIPARAAVQAG